MNDKQIAYIISQIMRWGVILSLSLACIGGVIYLYRHGHETVHFGAFTANDESIGTIISTMFQGIITGKGRAYINLGILLLFTTPVLRVVFSLFGFIAEKDKTYIVITSIVILIIIISLTGGLAH